MSDPVLNPLCMEHSERIAILEVTVRELTTAVTELTKSTKETHDSFKEAMAFGKGVIWVLGIIATAAIGVAAISLSIDIQIM